MNITLGTATTTEQDRHGIWTDTNVYCDECAISGAVPAGIAGTIETAAHYVSRTDRVLRRATHFTRGFVTVALEEPGAFNQIDMLPGLTTDEIIAGITALHQGIFHA